MLTRTLIAAALLVVLPATRAEGQVPSHPDAQSPLKENPYLRHENAYRWDMVLQIFVRESSFDYVQGETVRTVTPDFAVDDLEVILPVMREGGFYWDTDTPVESRFRIKSNMYNGITVTKNHVEEQTFEPTILEVPGTEAAYSLVEFPGAHNHIQIIHLRQRARVVSADTRFDERLAAELPWPDRWPESAELMLEPVVDRVVEPVEQEGVDAIAHLVDRWTEGQDPKSIPQITLVKYLTGHVLDYVRVGRPKAASSVRYSNRVLADLNQSGVPTNATGVWSGLNVRSGDLVALRPERSSPLDLSTFLTSVLRAAGVPARLAICFSTDEEVPVLDRIFGVVEFAMFDPDRDQLMWVPIDIERLRDSGRRLSSYKQPWLYFGTHDKLHEYVPVAHYYHPPVNYKAFGFPSFYGVRSNSPLSGFSTQHMMLDAMMAPVSGHDFKD